MSRSPTDCPTVERTASLKHWAHTIIAERDALKVEIERLREKAHDVEQIVTEHCKAIGSKVDEIDVMLAAKNAEIEWLRGIVDKYHRVVDELLVLAKHHGWKLPPGVHEELIAMNAAAAKEQPACDPMDGGPGRDPAEV